MATGCFVNIGSSVAAAEERVKAADRLGAEAVYSTQVAGHDTLTAMARFAAGTERVILGTGVVPIYTRTPATMAQSAATLAEVSGGRFRLGIGVSHRPVVEHWHGQRIDRPVAEMREYATTVREILAGHPPGAGEKWPTSFMLALGERPVPIYIAALSPAMLRLAGEIADGVMLWLCNAEYVREVAIPAIAQGAAQGGRDLGDIDVVAAIPAAAADDPADARASLRGELLPYFGLPFYRTMIERSGFGPDIAAFDAAGGDGERMRAAISDDFIDSLAGVGGDSAVGDAVRRYRDAGASSPCVNVVGGADFERTLAAALAA